jgi:translocation and assembly module TamB
LSESDVLSLITLGLTSRDKLTTGASAGVAASAIFSASGLDSHVQRFLRRNIGLKDQQLYFTTSFNEITGAVDPAFAWESKIASDNLKVGLIQPVTGRGTKAQAEYFIDQRVSARLQWDNQTVNTTYGNPGVELRLRFEWE